jgi:hypothetical protein
MQPRWRAVLAFFLMILLLTGGGLLATSYYFDAGESIVNESMQTVSSDTIQSDYSLTEKQYRKIRWAFNSFDLAAGLTKKDLETIPVCNTYFVAFAWLCVGSVFMLKKPRKNVSE